MNDNGAEAFEKAVDSWAREKVSALAKLAIGRLTRLRASRSFAGYSYRSVWGEFSHDVQEGGFGDLSELLEDLARDVCGGVVAKLSPAEARLLRLWAEEEDKQIDELVLGEVSAIAANRDLARYSDDYRWYLGR